MHTSDFYAWIQQKIVAEECVILDGGVSTELQCLGLKVVQLSDQDLWGTWELYHTPHTVLEVCSHCVRSDHDQHLGDAGSGGVHGAIGHAADAAS